LKKIFRKKQLIITTLAFMLAVAGYISYDRINSKDSETAGSGVEVAEEGYVIDNTTYDIFEETDSAETMAESIESGNDTSGAGSVETAADSTAADDADVALNDTLDSEDSVSDSEDIINAGETVLTSLSVTSADYAAEVKLNREQVRSKNKEALLEIIDNESLSDSQKQDALDEMVALTDISEKEANAEMLLEAKGFTNVVVSISDDTCDVVVDMGDVTDAKRAQVEDIVKRKTGIAAENIIITAISADSSGLEQ
jgi:stage III sporulation protein AH